MMALKLPRSLKTYPTYTELNGKDSNAVSIDLVHVDNYETATDLSEFLNKDKELMANIKVVLETHVDNFKKSKVLKRKAV